MRPDEIKQEIEKLGIPEKIALVGDVWDSIARDNAELPLLQWQKQELDKRYTAYNQGEQDLHDWQTVHEELRNKHK